MTPCCSVVSIATKDIFRGGTPHIWKIFSFGSFHVPVILKKRRFHWDIIYCSHDALACLMSKFLLISEWAKFCCGAIPSYIQRNEEKEVREEPDAGPHPQEIVFVFRLTDTRRRSIHFFIWWVQYIVVIMNSLSVFLVWLSI